MIRLLYLLPLLLFSCLLAAGYGALHNQISYLVSPEYFHEFKFVQFQIDPAFHSRMGASLVGALASWWMGVVLGVPLFFVGMFIKGEGVFWRCYMKGCCLVVVVTLLIGFGALVYALLSFGPGNLPAWMAGRQVADPVAFAAAGLMHNFSYLGGIVGTGIGLGYMMAVAWASRQHPPA